MAALWGLCEQNAEVHGGNLSFFSSCSPGRAESCPEAPHTVCPTGMASGCQPLPPRALTELKLSQAGQWAMGCQGNPSQPHAGPEQHSRPWGSNLPLQCQIQAQWLGYKTVRYIHWSMRKMVFGCWILPLIFSRSQWKVPRAFFKDCYGTGKVIYNCQHCAVHRRVCPDQKQGVWGNTFLSCLHCIFSKALQDTGLQGTA